MTHHTPKKDTTEEAREASNEAVPTPPKHHKRRSKKTSIAVGVPLLLLGILAAVFIVPQLLPLPLKDWSYSYNGTPKRHFTIKVPSSFVKASSSINSESSGVLKDPSNNNAYLAYNVGSSSGSGGIDEYKKALKQAHDDTLEAGEVSPSVSSAQGFCINLLTLDDKKLNSAKDSDIEVWDVAIGSVQEYPYRYGMTAISVDVSCTATKDIASFAIKKGEVYTTSYFIAERRDKKSGSVLSNTIGITAPVNHRLHKAKQQIFDSLTMTTGQD